MTALDTEVQAMDPRDTLSAMPGAEPIRGLPDAWHWSPNPRFHFAAALTKDKAHVIQVNARDGYAEDLVRDLLAFVRERGEDVLADRRPLIPLVGFAVPGHDFDTAAVVSPAVHDRHARENPELHDVTYAVFPGWHYEFSGTETVTEARFRFGHPQGIPTAKLDREPVPFLRMRYQNTKTKGGSEGPDRHFAKPAVLWRELELLDGAEDSFVEFENFRLHVWRVEWAGTWVLIDDDRRRTMSLAQVRAFAEAVLNDKPTSEGIH
jgi:hypothetical protein